VMLIFCSLPVLAARSSAGHSMFARPPAPMPLATPPVVPPVARGESGGLHCDHCGHNGHVEAFCYSKKKAQKAKAHHSRILVVLVLEDLRGLLLVQRHRRFSCCYIVLRPLRRQELLVL
jgi:hypothetical protein